VPRSERPVPPGPLQAFASDLRALRRQAGSPDYRSLGTRAHLSASTLSEAAKGLRLPTLTVTLAYVQACSGDVEQWRARWTALDAALREGPTAVPEDTAAEEAEGTAAGAEAAVVTAPAGGEPAEPRRQPTGPDEGGPDDRTADPSTATGRRRTAVVAAGGAVLGALAVLAVLAGQAWFGGDDGGPVHPTRDPGGGGGVTAFCNAGTQGIGVMHNSDGDYSLGDFDVSLASNTCTNAESIGWAYVQGFYVGPDHCVDVRIDGSAEGHRVLSGQWFFDETITGTYNLNASNC
jgi:hypothetical protein